MKFRIFSNDRGSIKGVPMYSALMDADADSPEMALAQAPPRLDKPPYAKMVAIEWPAVTDRSKNWLKEHVDTPDEGGRKRSSR